ncbi:MAG: hypothetical protein IKV86_06310 [Clostridia bacterium]|nr:hypothetical protein [Clostridia bacterium]
MKINISKILSLTIILAMVLCLGACGEDAEKTDAKPAASAETADAPNTPVEESVQETEQPSEPASEDSSENTEEEKTEDAQKSEEPSKQEADNNTKSDNSTTPESKVAEFVKNNGASLTARLEKELSAKKITSTCTLASNGTRIVVTCKLAGYNNLSEADKYPIKLAAYALDSTVNTEFAKLVEKEPAISGADFKICEEDGDIITTISVNK